MKHFLAAIIAAATAVCASPAFGHTEDCLQGEVRVEIVSDSGGTLFAYPCREFRHGMTRIVKQYIEAQRNENYAVVIRNSTNERIGVVVAVDGRNIISGKRSDLAAREEMYIVDPGEQGRYDGWRTDRDTVHRFYFTDPGDSYSVRTFNDASAMGVIAVAVYREKERPQLRSELKRNEPAPAAPSAESARGAQPQASIDKAAGTGFGEGSYSPTVRVAFEPEARPVQKNLLKYEWRETLCRKGIIRCGRETGNRLWDGDGYAPYPPGYER